jgi:hypothetical protein
MSTSAKEHKLVLEYASEISYREEGVIEFGATEIEGTRAYFDQGRVAIRNLIFIFLPSSTFE